MNKQEEKRCKDFLRCLGTFSTNSTKLLLVVFIELVVFVVFIELVVLLFSSHGFTSFTLVFVVFELIVVFSLFVVFELYLSIIKKAKRRSFLFFSSFSNLTKNQ